MTIFFLTHIGTVAGKPVLPWKVVSRGCPSIHGYWRGSPITRNGLFNMKNLHSLKTEIPGTPKYRRQSGSMAGAMMYEILVGWLVMAQSDKPIDREELLLDVSEALNYRDEMVGDAAAIEAWVEVQRCLGHEISVAETIEAMRAYEAAVWDGPPPDAVS